MARIPSFQFPMGGCSAVDLWHYDGDLGFVSMDGDVAAFRTAFGPLGRHCGNAVWNHITWPGTVFHERRRRVACGD